MDLLKACREFKTKFPKPVPLMDLSMYAVQQEVPVQELTDIFQVLKFAWRRSGWALCETYAVQLEEDEEAMFHEKGITIIKLPDDLPSDKALLKLIPMGEADEKVVWF